KPSSSTAPPATSSAKPAKGINRATRRLRDHNGQQLAYIYFEGEPGRRSAAKLPTKDEARGISPSCRSFSAKTKAPRPPPLAPTSRPYPRTGTRRLRTTTRYGHNSRTDALTIPRQ